MTDRYERIRSALEMGPTPGPWSFKDNSDGSINLFGDGRLFSAHCRLMNKPANEAYISACDPDTIRELLAERDVLRELEERKQRDEALLRQALEALDVYREYDPEGGGVADNVAAALRERLGDKA